MEFLTYLSEFFNSGIILYAVSLILAYIILSVLSIRETIFYMRKNSFADYRNIMTSPLTPPVSLIAPAYNEGATIIENIRSLLSLYYADFEIIIVNDGSTDDTLKKIIEEYSLVKVDFAVNEKLKTKSIKNIYKSTNPVFNKLTVVDKENGGKSDALNAGINVSKNDLIACCDVDSILEQDSLLKLVKPFLESSKVRTIAAGGVVRIANDCEIENGRIVKVNFPKKFFPRIQVLEYIRAFLLARMAWSRLNGVLIISGAFGMFEKDVVIKAGGYSDKTVGEDLELVVRMRKYMHDNGIKYRIVYIPDPLCWTESPTTIKILSRQRNRWTRGLIGTLFLHIRTLFNPKYKILGMVSFPYWLIYEWAAPIIEFFGILYFLFLAVFGFADWTFILLVFLAVYSFALLYSFTSIFIEEFSFHQYKSLKDIFKLSLVAFLEPLSFHFLTLIWAVKGNLDYLSGERKWGEMKREGFRDNR